MGELDIEATWGQALKLDDRSFLNKPMLKMDKALVVLGEGNA